MRWKYRFEWIQWLGPIRNADAHRYVFKYCMLLVLHFPPFCRYSLANLPVSTYKLFDTSLSLEKAIRWCSGAWSSRGHLHQSWPCIGHVLKNLLISPLPSAWGQIGSPSSHSTDCLGSWSAQSSVCAKRHSCWARFTGLVLEGHLCRSSRRSGAWNPTCVDPASREGWG